VSASLCDICKKSLEGEEKSFAENQAEHPGYFGLIDPKCYSGIVGGDPSLPWTDPISGETDWEEMQSALGFGDDPEDGDY
jgi:hypothetical protein